MQSLGKLILRLFLAAWVTCSSQTAFAEQTFSDADDTQELSELNKENEKLQEELSRAQSEEEENKKPKEPPVAIPLYASRPQVFQTLAVTASNLAEDFYTGYPNIMGRLTSYLAQALIVNANAEAGGRFSRALEFNGRLDRVSFTPIFIFGGYCSICILPPTATPQEVAIVSTATTEQNRIFIYALITQSLRLGAPVNPSQGVAMFASSTSQLFSIYITDDKDVSTYVQNINTAYGSGTISKQQIRAVAWLELLNPLIYTSLYSSVMNEDAPLRVFDINGFKVMPSIQVILTPYGALEKRLVTYMPRGLKNFTFSAGFGRDALNRQTYFLEYGSDNIASLWGINVSGSAALWRQPDLFAPDPRTSRMHVGTMVHLKTDYLIKDYLALHAELACKTAGFVQGQPLKRGCTTLVATQFQW